MLTVLLAAILGVLILILASLMQILANLRGEPKDKYPPLKLPYRHEDESDEHHRLKTPLLIMEEIRRGEMWNPSKESIEEFMGKGQQLKND